MDFQKDPRFSGIEPLRERLWLSSPTMHGEERRWVDEAIQTNWVSTIGANISTIEKQMAEYIGIPHAIALSSGTAALHLAIRLAAEKLYGQAPVGHGTLEGRKVFCSDITFDATVNPVAYEGGEVVLIDTERDTWNMDPGALEKAFAMYPEVRLIVLAHLYGTPGKMDEIRQIASSHGALIVEDAAESLGATYKDVQTGLLGDYGIISFNGNKIITGSTGGMMLCREEADANKIRKWSTQSREAASWYQHEELGYNYRMSNIVAGIVRGQIPYLDQHIEQKRAIYEQYQEGLKDLPVTMNPWDREKSSPNFWLSCLLINEDRMAPHVRGEQEELWSHEPGKSSPGEILAALAAFRAEGRPIWKPMHLQPIYRMHPFITRSGTGRGQSNAYLAGESTDVGADIFRRGLCLPSDNKMTLEQQRLVIEIIHRCFR